MRKRRKKSLLQKIFGKKETPVLNFDYDRDYLEIYPIGYLIVNRMLHKL